MVRFEWLLGSKTHWNMNNKKNAQNPFQNDDDFFLRALSHAMYYMIIMLSLFHGDTFCSISVTHRGIITASNTDQG